MGILGKEIPDYYSSYYEEAQRLKVQVDLMQAEMDKLVPRYIYLNSVEILDENEQNEMGILESQITTLYFQIEQLKEKIKKLDFLDRHNRNVLLGFKGRPQ